MSEFERVKVFFLDKFRKSKRTVNETVLLPSVQILSSDMEEVLTYLINYYIQVEKTETGQRYQKKNSFTMGQINIITSLIGEKWDYHETGQCYYDFLKYLVEKYKLSGVSRINDL